MANEFERAKYRSAIQAKLLDAADKVEFTDRYVYVGAAFFGEYSFDDHSFPIGVQDTGFRYFNYNVGGKGIEINPFPLDQAVNLRDFAWSLAMPEEAARAFLKSYPGRRIAVRIVYSPTRSKDQERSSRIYLRPFIHSVESYSDTSFSKGLGALPKTGSSVEPPVSRAVQRAADAHALAEAANTLVGAWRYGGNARDGGDVYDVSADGTYRRTSKDEITRSRGNWSINGDLITIAETEVTIWGSRRSVSPPLQMRIVEIGAKQLVMKSVDGRDSETTWSR